MSDDLHPLTNGTDLVPTPFEDVATPFTGVVGTDFLMFGVGGGANVEAQVDYQNDPQRPTGNLPGLARSNFNNKAIRQGTFVAHSLCLWVSEQIQVYIPDDGNDIAWIGEFSAALAQFILALMPPAPQMGAYLPLAGGLMSGNITFLTGISTILNNNTWYYGRDTAGTARGLILKGSDNNIYINDGSCPYVMFNGSPIISNNTWYGARSTTNSLHGIIGILSDNNTHVASGPAAHIFLDCGTGGSVWTSGNIVINNGQFYYSKSNDGNPRGILGITAGNALQLGGGTIGQTDIYAGGSAWIYMRSLTNFLSQIIVNQYSYLNGGGRAYVPGGDDPWQVYADQGHYSRTHFIVGNTRDWTAGCLRGGTFGIADESAAAMRFEIDLAGHTHHYGNIYGNDCSFGGVTTTALHATQWGQVDGGLTVYNSLNVASGNLLASGTGYIYTGLNVWNSAVIQSGRLTVNADCVINAGLTVFNGFNMASGTTWLNGVVNMYSNAYIAGTLQIGGLSPVSDGGNNWLNVPGNINVYQGTLNAAWATVGNNLSVGYDLNVGHGVSAGALFSTGFSYSGLESNGNIWLKAGRYGNSNGNVVFDGYGGRGYAIRAAGDWFWVSEADSNYPPNVIRNWWAFMASAVQLFSNDGFNPSEAYKPGGGFWAAPSERRLKREIQDYDCGLETIRQLRPRSFRYNNADIFTVDDGKRYHGFIVDEVEDIMPELVHDYDRGSTYGTVKAINMTPVIYAMLNAIKTLAERVEALEAGKA